MKICCNQNHVYYDCLSLSVPQHAPVILDNFVYTKGWVRDNISDRYSVSVGQDYTVFAVLLYTDRMWYLVADDGGEPRFFPSECFEVTEPYLVYDWTLARYDVKGHVLTLIGYDALCTDYTALTDLLDGHPAAVAAFLRYKEGFSL